ncbi:sugar ABC transporter substrate-binding protein [Butyricicoccus sp. AF18-9LB]|uniref:sugar ABC transporter substrate-binding protein n=1 Tax=Butyricicoccus sp. AF18-9LB TaxID=3002521 RepID=UPI002ED52421
MIWSHAFSICLSAENMLKYYQEKIGSSSRQKRKRGGTSHEKENDRSSTGMPCLRGYRSAVEQAGGTVLEVQYCDAQPGRAAAAMEVVMQKYPQGVDAVLVTSDDMALAAIKCIWDNNSDAYRKTVICGFDGNQAAVEALDRGELTVDIAQQGYEMGYKAVEAALDALEGKSVESVIDSGSEVITADNIDAYIADCREKGLWS